MPQFALRRPQGFIALAGIAAITAALVAAQAPDVETTPVDQLTAQAVAALLERDHISKPTINDEIAVSWAENFIETLDPLKYNFLKADVEEFMARAKSLDDRIEEGDISFAEDVFTRFLERSDTRLEAAREILAEMPDFTIDETVFDPSESELIEYPATAEEARERLRKVLKLEVLQLKVADTEDSPEEALHRIVVRHQDLNRRYHNFDSGDLLELYLTALTTAVDPQSQYMGAEFLEDFMNQQLHLSLEGIGASLSMEDGLPVVREIVPGGAADKDGRLMPEDRIVGIENEKGEKDDFYGKKLSDIVRKIRGPKGTKIRLLVQPADSKEVKTYELTRQKIELKEQHAAGKIIETSGANGQPLKIGVIQIPSFYGDTLAVLRGDPEAISVTQDVARILKDFKKRDADAVLVDLRWNPGGLLSEAITLSGLFIDTGPVVQVRDFSGVKHLDDNDEGTVWDGPVAVIINHGSASASEIFAGVIRDYDRGLIIGDSSTYGKGTVQSIVMLNERLQLAGPGAAGVPNLGALKLTIQQFYRANGDSTQIKGVKPHVHIPSFWDYRGLGEGENDNALEFDQVPPQPHDDYGRITEELASTLQKRSDERREKDEDFVEQAEAIERYMARKASHQISLNEKTYRAEVDAEELDTDAAKDEDGKDKNEDPQGITEREVWDQDSSYNEEVMKILADYINLGGEILTAGPVSAGDTRKPLRP